jgi:hypothetical protein
MNARHRTYVALAAVAGVGMLVWTVVSVGPRALMQQGRALGIVLPMTLGLAALRFLSQAAGWRLALPADQRPTWGEAFAAVVAGEAAGYFAWGPVSREPMKALLIEHRVARPVGLAAAVLERAAYAGVAAMLCVAALSIAGAHSHRWSWIAWSAAGAVLIVAIAKLMNARRSTRSTTDLSHAIPGPAGHLYADLRQRRPAALAGVVAFGAVQEVTNLAEAYIGLLWLGAVPTVATVIVMEGLSRLVNAAAQFIPGKLGLPEAASTMLANGLALGGPQGLSLALARRVRSLLWGTAGVAFLSWRAARGTAPAAFLASAAAVA